MRLRTCSIAIREAPSTIEFKLSLTRLEMQPELSVNSYPSRIWESLPKKDYSWQSKVRNKLQYTPGLSLYNRQSQTRGLSDELPASV